ncbi:MAG TPA: dethiobiotin synthase [Deltaproteobacteria bacterium]|nr:dethiobiotin synthase [Deltaproteobacteria bacterium]
MPGLFITGTDTNVGKTLVTAGIAAYLRECGIDAAVMKPVESGCRRGVSSGDSAYLKKISRSSEPLNRINTYAFQAPLAPSVAAELEGVKISFKRIHTAFRHLERRHSFVLVEGAGGVAVPLGPRQSVADLIASLKIPTLLVARMALGTLNHSFLTLEYLRQRRIPVVGVVFNCTERRLDASAKYNLQTFQERSPVPVWGVVKHVGKIHHREEILEKIQSGIGPALEAYFEVK